MEGLSALIFPLLLVVIFYFMLIRPQKRRVAQHQSLIESLDVGDDIVTIGGVHGTIRSIGDDTIEVEVAPGTTLRFAKSAVARVVTEEAEREEDIGRTSEEEGA